MSLSFLLESIISILRRRSKSTETRLRPGPPLRESLLATVFLHGKLLAEASMNASHLALDRDGEIARQAGEEASEGAPLFHVWRRLG